MHESSKAESEYSNRIQLPQFTPLELLVALVIARRKYIISRFSSAGITETDIDHTDKRIKYHAPFEPMLAELERARDAHQSIVDVINQGIVDLQTIFSDREE